MGRLLVIDPHCGGHHPRYVVWVARAALARGYDVHILTSRSCLGHEGYGSSCDGLPGGIRFSATPYELDFSSIPSDVVGLTGREFLYWRLLLRAYRAQQGIQSADLVCLPYLDYCAYAIALLGSPFGETPWMAITMRPSFHYPAIGIRCPRSRLPATKEWLFLRLLASQSLTRIFSIDELLEKYVSEKAPPLAGKVRYVPDPAEMRGSADRAAARAVLGIPDDAFVVLSYGSVDPRKGLDSLLGALSHPQLPRNLHALVAGVQTPAGRAMLTESGAARQLRREGRLHVVEGYLGMDAEYSVFAASDAAWLGYRDHYTMSGAMVQAGRMGLPVVACREGLIGWTTLTYGLGLTVDVDDGDSVAGALSAIAGDPIRAARLGENGRRRFEHHTVEEFGRVLFDRDGGVSGELRA